MKSFQIFLWTMFLALTAIAQDTLTKVGVPPKSFMKLVTGTDSLLDFGVLVFFAGLGVLLSLLLNTTSRSVDSVSSPWHFSWKYLWCDNTKRLLAGGILIFIALRFTPELFGVTITNFWALAIGFGSDKLAQIVKDKTGFLSPKS